MKRYFFILTALLFTFSASAFAEEKIYPGPQEAAPNVYKKLFDNESVLISEITFKPGDKAPMHTHPYKHSVYIIEGGELTLSRPGGTSAVATAKAGDVLWFPAETHEALNTGITTVRGVITEIK